MNKDICIIVAWQRAEFLQLCLELVMRCDDADKLFYVFALDEGHDILNYELIKQFPFENTMLTMGKSGYKLGKQSYNVLNSMLAAANQTKELVYYVEEDIFIGKDFFTFHKDLHEKEPDIFCSVGTKCNNTNWQTIADQDAYYLSPNPDYQSWGSCFKKDMLNKYIKPHFVENYFNDPAGYCRRFKDSIIGHFFCEQDGLIRRIKEKDAPELKIAYPHVPRGYHAGFYGYNRQQKKLKTHKDRVELLRKVCFNKELMRKHSKPGLADDSVPVDLNTNHKKLYYAEGKTV